VIPSCLFNFVLINILVRAEAFGLACRARWESGKKQEAQKWVSYFSAGEGKPQVLKLNPVVALKTDAII